MTRLAKLECKNRVLFQAVFKTGGQERPFKSQNSEGLEIIYYIGGIFFEVGNRAHTDGFRFKNTEYWIQLMRQHFFIRGHPYQLMRQ